MLDLPNKAQDLLDDTRIADFLTPLLLRLYLISIFWTAGTQKLSHFGSIVEWFSNLDWNLKLPVPMLMAVSAEIGSAILYTLGLATCWISLPLMVTIIVAVLTTHLENGWLAIAASDGVFATERTIEVAIRLKHAHDILQEHGNYEWLTEHGSFVMLSNGIELAMTCFVMILALFFTSGGKYLSLDYWIAEKFRHQ